MLALIGKLYDIERETKQNGLDAPVVKELRQQHSKPILDEISPRLNDWSIEVLPKSSIGQAVSYARGQWGVLNQYRQVREYSQSRRGGAGEITPTQSEFERPCGTLREIRPRGMSRSPDPLLRRATAVRSGRVSQVLSSREDSPGPQSDHRAAARRKPWRDHLH